MNFDDSKTMFSTNIYYDCVHIVNLAKKLSMIPCISKDEKLCFDNQENKYECQWYLTVAWKDQSSQCSSKSLGTDKGWKIIGPDIMCHLVSIIIEDRQPDHAQSAPVMVCIGSYGDALALMFVRYVMEDTVDGT